MAPYSLHVDKTNRRSDGGDQACEIRNAGRELIAPRHVVGSSLVHQLPHEPVGHDGHFFVERRPGMTAAWLDDEFRRDALLVEIRLLLKATSSSLAWSSAKKGALRANQSDEYSRIFL